MHNQLCVTAMWAHILNEYIWDKQNTVYLFYKLTDAYPFHTIQYAMKFGLVAQVMGNAV